MFKKIAVAAMLALVSSVSMAAEERPVYVGGDLGNTRNNQSSDRGFAIGVFAGYKFTPHIAVEASYRHMEHDSYAIIFENHGVTAEQYALSAIGSVPLNDKFSVYGRLGYNQISTTVKRSANRRYEDHENRALYGIGLTYSFGKLVSARVEVQKPKSNMTNLSAGLAFSF
jgi:OOP family OmpA-OmpF porin